MPLQPHDFDNGNDNLYSLWSLNGQVLGNDDSGEAKKAADWKAATGLLSSLDLCSGDGHHLEDMLSNLLDTTSDISLSTIGSWESTAKCPPPETGTTFNDIEQLCIRMAEHALDISGENINLCLLNFTELTFFRLQTIQSSLDYSVGHVNSMVFYFFFE